MDLIGADKLKKGLDAFPENTRKQAELLILFFDSIDLSLWTEEMGVGLVRGIRKGIEEWKDEIAKERTALE